MVKRRAFSSSDEYTTASSQRKNKILSPRTPKSMLKHQQFFDFSKITTTTKTTTLTPKRRSASWSGVEDEPSSTSITFRRVCRKYTISGEVAEQLAKIGDEIMRDYESMLKEFNVVSLYQFFNVTMGMKRRKTASPQQQQQHQQQRADNSRKRKISGYLGILLIHFIKNL